MTTRDPHLCMDIDALESVQRFTTKSAQNPGLQIISIVWINFVLHLQTLNMKSYQCHLYKLVHDLSIKFPNSPITTSSSDSYPTCSNHNPSLHVPSSHTNAYFILFFVISYVPATHYLTLLCHYRALIYLKRQLLLCFYRIVFTSGYILELGLQKKQQQKNNSHDQSHVWSLCSCH